MLFRALEQSKKRLSDPARNALDVILWWESRRIPYNVIVGSWGWMCLWLYSAAVQESGHLEAGEDAIEPMALFVAPVLVNICYTIGWPVELLLRRIRPDLPAKAGERLYRAGICFSLFVISLPAVIWCVIWFLS
jgi:hypothetical protein